jgi:diguanylate cyclase (GGDEF)-like protein
MDDWDRQKTSLTVAVESFRETVADVGNQVVAPLEGPNGDRARTLIEAAQALSESEADLLRQTRQRLREDLTNFGSRIRELVAGQKDLTDVLHLLERATASLSVREKDNQEQVREMAREMEHTARLDSLEAVRTRIRTHVRALVDHADRMATSFQSSIKNLQVEVDGYRSRLAKAESDAQTDELTGLPNRRALEAGIERLSACGATFTLALADLDRFKLINDIHGHLAGDEVLKIFAARLRGSLRQGDLVARWGGDEFVVVLRCGMSDALARVRQLQSRLSGPYSIRREGASPLRLEVSASIGLAEKKPSETTEQLLARADQLLYQRKAI